MAPKRDPAHPSVLSPDLAPGIDEIYEESQQVFLAPGHPQDGQVVFYKVSGHWPSLLLLFLPELLPYLMSVYGGRSAWTAA